MAIGQKETDLLTSFWEKNYKLIMAIFKEREYNKSSLAHAIVKDYVEQNPDITLNELVSVSS